MGAVAMYIILGEAIDWSDPEFDGYVLTNDDAGTKLLLRRFFGIIGVISFVLAFTWLRSLAYLERALQRVSRRNQREPDAPTAAAALQASHIARIASLESIATFGLVLYFLGGERVDLYGFCAAAMIGLLLTWPRAADGTMLSA